MSSAYATSGPPSSGGVGAPPTPSPSPPTVQPTLKVMRLYKPKLYAQVASGGSMLPTSMAEATATQHEFALSSMLILPDSFGFSWATPSAATSASLTLTRCELRDVGLSANIQCSNDRVELHDNRYARTGKLPPPNPVAVLAAGSSLDMVVDYPLNQVGNHVLRVGVAYVDPVIGESKSLRKFYRFAVQNPLVITFKQHSPATQQQGEGVVEAQIRNASKLPLFVDSIKFLPLPPFTSEEILVEFAGKKTGAEQPSVQDLLAATNGPQTLVYPQEELQRVFRISYDPASDPTLLASQGSQNLGRLHVGWKISMGEAGSVQSQLVMRKAPGDGHTGIGAGQHSEVTVVIEELPKEVVVGQPFLVPVSVTNNSLRSLALQLQFRKELMHGIVCSSASYQNIGVMEAKSVKTVWAEFLPVVGGLQPLGGPVCVNISSGQEFIQADSLAHVLVAPSASCKTLE